MFTIIDLRGEKMKNNEINLFLKLKVIVILGAFIFLSFAPITNSLEIRTTLLNETNQFENSGFSFQISFDAFQTSLIEVEGELYTKLKMDSCGFTADYGKVELPTYSYNIGVPQGAEYILSYEVSDPVVISDYNIYPAQPPTPDSYGFIDPPFTKDEEFYSTNEFYPESIVEVTSDAIIRGCRIIRISVYPLLYNPVTKTLKKYNVVDVNVDFIGGTNEFIPERLRSPYFQPIFDSFLINSQQVERAQMNNPTGY
jgi:hypothetical protein